MLSVGNFWPESFLLSATCCKDFQPFKKFALGQGRGHKQEQSSQEEDEDGQNEASDEGS